MLKAALTLVLGLLLATCGPAENAKLPGGASPGGSTGGKTGGAAGSSPIAGSGGSSAGGSSSGGSSSGGSSGGGSSSGGSSGGGSGSGGSSGGGSGGSGTSKLDGSGIPDAAIPDDVSEPCANPTDISGGNTTGKFHTAKAFCFRTCDEIQGWGCSNFAGRTVKVNGQPVKCGEAMPAKLGPFYYFDISAGDLDYASVYWWGKYYGVPAGGYTKWDQSSTPDAGAADGPAASSDAADGDSL